MNYATTAEKVKEIDRKAVEEWGIPSSVLMENAGRSAVEVIRDKIPRGPRKIVVICGKGNNGGDGLVVARRMIDLGFQVETFVLGNRSLLARETERNAKLLERMTGRVNYCSPGDDQLLKKIENEASVIIDAIFGIGIEGELRGDYPELVDNVNDSSCQKISIDIPSGLPADTGRPHGPAVRAGLTVTMGFIKLGTLVPEAKKYVGNQVMASVGYPEALIREEEGVWEIINGRAAKDLMPDRPSGNHKGDFGSLLVVGGSTGMTGAPLLAAKSGLRSGTGLVFLAGPKSGNQVFETNLVEGLTVPLPDERGYLGPESMDSLREAARDKDGIAIGPGLGRREVTGDLVVDILSQVSQPTVLDADGVIAFSGRLDRLKEIDNLVLTPHPGELAELLDISPGEVDRKRYEIVPDLARDLGVTLLLKGVPTVIGSHSGEVALVTCPNSGLAKGGSGDVLTGLIGSFLAQGLPPFFATELGAWVHCRAGKLGAGYWGKDSLQPGDMLDFIAPALKEIRRKKEE